MKPVSLRPITEGEFADYQQLTMKTYAEEKVKGESLTSEEAQKESERAFAHLFPEGLRSDGQFVFKIIENSTQERVGTLWLGTKKTAKGKYAYVYDITLDDRFQGKGYGKAAMLLAEEEALSRGLKKIGLHVFGHNTRARNLYEKLGYRATSILMSKDL